MFRLWRIGKFNKAKENLSPVSGAITSYNIKKILGDSSDVIIKDVYSYNKNIKIKIIAIDGMIDSKIIDESILKPLTFDRFILSSTNEKEVYKLVKEGLLYHVSQEEIPSLEDAITKILQGVTVVVFDGIKKAVAFDAKNIPQRSVTPPNEENVLKGAKDAFVENIRTNTALVRKKIKSLDLKIENFKIGTYTNTPVSVVYLDSIVNKDILDKVIKRIKDMDIPNLISPENFENSFKDNKYSIFPQLHYTERVDKFCANLLDGKIGIIIDGLPIVYIVPGVLAMFLQAPEDYSQNYVLSSAVRFMRYLCVWISLILPAFYVAITTFHHEMIPTNLLISIIESKEGVPFATFLEVLGLLLSFELLLEASLRLPKSVGATISIIGALIVGEAAVNASFISPAVVVIVAITGVTGFVIPSQDFTNSIRVFRVIMVFIAGISGLFGLSFIILVILAYLCKLETFGVPYFTPFAGNEWRNILKDTIVRLPRDVERVKR